MGGKVIENKYIACLGFFYVFVSLTSCDFAESNNKVGVGSTLIQPSAKLGENWVLLEEYSDEFNGITLDREKWDNDIPDTGWKSWEPENILVKDGVLQLVMQYKEHFRGDLKLYYTSGAISTKAGPFKYGYSEIRLKAAPLHPGVVSAFWARGKSEGMRTEIDFVEMPQQRRVNIIDFRASCKMIPLWDYKTSIVSAEEISKNSFSPKHTFC